MKKRFVVKKTESCVCNSPNCVVNEITYLSEGGNYYVKISLAQLFMTKSACEQAIYQILISTGANDNHVRLFSIEKIYVA